MSLRSDFVRGVKGKVDIEDTLLEIARYTGLAKRMYDLEQYRNRVAGDMQAQLDKKIEAYKRILGLMIDSESGKLIPALSREGANIESGGRGYLIKKYEELDAIGYLSNADKLYQLAGFAHAMIAGEMKAIEQQYPDRIDEVFLSRQPDALVTKANIETGNDLDRLK